MSKANEEHERLREKRHDVDSSIEEALEWADHYASDMMRRGVGASWEALTRALCSLAGTDWNEWASRNGVHDRIRRIREKMASAAKTPKQFVAVDIGAVRRTNAVHRPHNVVIENMLDELEWHRQAREIEADRLKVGDRVQLKSGGPVMEVRETIDAAAYCEWDHGLSGRHFHPDMLRRVARKRILKS